MRDPTPQNITGEKVQRHVFKHKIQWGYVAMAVAVIYVVMRVGPMFAGDADDKQGKTEKSGIGTEV